MLAAKIKNIGKNTAQRLTNLIFPKSCFICNKIILDGILCLEHWNKIKFLQKPACKICFDPFEFKVDDEMICAACLSIPPTFSKAISVIKYDENSKALITKFKYSDQSYMAKYFATLMFNQLKNIDLGSLKAIDFIVPVPLHKMRLISRKYNQSALLVKNFSKLSNLPVIMDLLIRTKNTKPQASLNQKLRHKNVSNIFTLNKKFQKQIKGKNILLIDDVMTSGATIDACSKVLNKARVNKIYVLTLAKRVLE